MVDLLTSPEHSEPDGQYLNRRLLYVAVAFLLLFIGVVVYVIGDSVQQQQRQAAMVPLAPAAKAWGSEVADAEAPATQPVTVEPTPAPRQQQPVVQRETPATRSAPPPRQEDELVRMRRQKLIEALYAPPLVEDLGRYGQQQLGSSARLQQASTSGAVPDRPPQVLEIPSASSTLTGWSTDARRTPQNWWTRSFAESPPERTASVMVRPPVSPYVVYEGAVIPAVLVTGIHSDSPGQVTAQVTEPIYDSVTGQYPLIPPGSRLIGRHNSTPSYGAERLEVAWHRLLFPNGASLQLSAMPASDRAGYAGVPAQVNNHLWPTFWRATLLSFIGVGMQLGQNRQVFNRGYGLGGYSATDVAAAEAAREYGQIGRELARRGLNRPPTLTAAPGDPVLVQVTENLVLPGPYPDPTTRDRRP